MSRRGLGRGLDALLPSSASDRPGERDGLVQAQVDSIAPNPNQPRRAFEDERLDELAVSISQLGVLQPLLVREVSSGSYELIAGERRLRAARKAGLESVPVVVVDTDTEGSIERALVENVHRENLNPIEEAAAYRQLMDEGGLTQESLGERIGKSRPAISNSLRLLDLPVGIQGALIDGRISAGHGKALLSLEGNPFQERLAKRVAQEGLSVRETEELVRKYRSMSEPQRGTTGSGSRSKPAEATEAEKLLSDRLGTRVEVQTSGAKGRVVLRFADLEELQRLVGEIAGDR